MSPVHTLPTELLIAVFQAVRSLCHDFPSSNSSLLSAALVCRRWSAAASLVLLSHVEITKPAHALALIQRLQLSNSPFIDELVVGMGGAKDSQSLIDDSLFLQLLSTPAAQRLKKLVILHQSSLGCVPYLPSLPCLTDVTLSAAGGAPASLSETTLIQFLPKQVRFLTLPGPERTRFVGPCTKPTFNLFGLSVQEYPTPTTKWLVGGDPTLQCLDVAFMAQLPQCIEAHPNLRSLRVLQRIGGSGASFEGLKCLERLELRDTAVKRDLVAKLPESLKYFRFWATELAAGLIDALESGRLSNIHTLVWDHFTPKGVVHATAMEDLTLRLTNVCQRMNIELRMYERKDGGRRASKEKDLAYESYLQASCFRVANEPIPSSSCSSLPTTALPVRVLRDMHNSGIPLAPQFKSISPFANSVPGMWSPVWEESFQGHGQWLEETLPALDSERKKQSLAVKPPTGSAAPAPGDTRIPRRRVF